MWAPKEEVKISEVKPLVEVSVDETADWKIYKNEEYGFEVKYPSNLIIKDINEGSVIKNPFAVGFLEPNRQNFFYSLRVINKNEPRQMSNFFDNPDDYKENKGDFHEDFRLKTIIIDDIEWKSYDYVGGSGEFPEPLHFITKKQNLIIEMVVANDSYMNVNQILSTFRFLE